MVNNPLKYVDPTGHRLSEDVEGGGGGGQNGGGGGGGRFDGSDYSPDGSMSDAISIVACWFTELCGAKQVFGPDSSLTQDIQYDSQTRKFRQDWGELGYPIPYEWTGTVDQREGPLVGRLAQGLTIFVVENVQLVLSLNGYGSKNPEGAIDPVGGILGSFDKITVIYAGRGMVRIDVFNITGWRSGTRIPGTDRSLFPDKPQSAPGPGGTFEQQFYWYESWPGSPSPLTVPFQ